jgi:hypothetical protein
MAKRQKIGKIRILNFGAIPQYRLKLLAFLWNLAFEIFLYRAKHGAVGETRTRDRRIRNPLLYPAELPPQTC